MEFTFSIGHSITAAMCALVLIEKSSLHESQSRKLSPTVLPSLENKEAWLRIAKTLSYVKIFFSNGDNIKLYDCEIIGEIGGSTYQEDELLDKFAESFPVEPRGFHTAEEILQKLQRCIEKAELFEYSVQQEEDQIAEFSFIADRFVIDEDVETPYFVSDFESIGFFKGDGEYEDPDCVIISFKNDENMLRRSPIFMALSVASILNRSKRLSKVCKMPSRKFALKLSLRFPLI